MTTQPQKQSLSRAQMTEIYNRISGEQVRRFRTQGEAVSAVLEAIRREKRTPRPGRRPEYSDDDVVVKVSENPKKPGTKAHERFKHYRAGMSVREFIEKGGLRADLSWDVEHGHIKIRRAR